MKTKRIKIKLPEIVTRADAEHVMRELAIAVNSQRKILADRDAEILKINQRVEEPLAKLGHSIDSKALALESWALANRDAFPKDRRSIIMTSGTLGFRTGNPKLSLLNRSWTWEKVLAALKNSCLGAGFIRTKEEVDKEGIIAAKLDSESLATAGVKVVQDELFFVDPALTDLPARQTTEAA